MFYWRTGKKNLVLQGSLFKGRCCGCSWAVIRGIEAQSGLSSSLKVTQPVARSFWLPRVSKRGFLLISDRHFPNEFLLSNCMCCSVPLLDFYRVSLGKHFCQYFGIGRGLAPMSWPLVESFCRCWFSAGGGAPLWTRGSAVAENPGFRSLLCSYVPYALRVDLETDDHLLVAQVQLIRSPLACCWKNPRASAVLLLALYV